MTGERTAELEAANRELEAFSYSVSHDLRAPLRAVDGFSRILLEEYSPELPEKARHYLTVTRNNAVQMGELIDDLLAFRGSSRHPLQQTAHRAGELVSEVLDDLHLRAGRPASGNNGGPSSALRRRPQLLKQVLVNLLSNGFKYTRTQEIARIEVGAMTPAGSNTPSITFAITASASICVTPTSSLVYSSACTEPRNIRERASAWPLSSGLCNVMAGRCGRSAAVNQGATFYFVLTPGLPHPRGEELEKCPTNP